MKKETVKIKLCRQAVTYILNRLFIDSLSFLEDPEMEIYDKLGNVIDEDYQIDFNYSGVFKFYFKGCPGWVFGIQFNPNHRYTSKFIKFEGWFVAQVERRYEPDKITSNLVIPFNFYYDGTVNHEVLEEIRDLLLFIKTEPALALCRDAYNFDYNKHYCSRENAIERATAYLQITGKTDEEIKTILKLGEKSERP